jgi:hypothetical protein
MNEPAFPGLHPSKECHYQDSGMSLRDYFAAKAMQAFLTRETKLSPNLMMYTGTAYDVADAMLEARNR